MNLFESENQFYLHCDPSRVSKFLAHAKLYEMSLNLPGHYMEAGVFKGASFCRMRKLGKLFHPDHTRRFIGFDVFGRFPEAAYEADRKVLNKQFESDGNEGISKADLEQLLQAQHLFDCVELIEGNVTETLPEYLARYEEVSFSIVNVDVDLYESTKSVLEHAFPRVVKGGVVILDDYEGFPGAKKAVDEYLCDHKRPEIIRKFPFALSPCYLIKE
jgi:hypothetical protein